MKAKVDIGVIMVLAITAACAALVFSCSGGAAEDLSQDTAGSKGDTGDSAADGALDAGALDTGAEDAGRTDAGAADVGSDSGGGDGGAADAGGEDAGADTPDGGVDAEMDSGVDADLADAAGVADTGDAGASSCAWDWGGRTLIGITLRFQSAYIKSPLSLPLGAIAVVEVQALFEDGSHESLTGEANRPAPERLHPCLSVVSTNPAVAQVLADPPFAVQALAVGTTHVNATLGTEVGPPLTALPLVVKAIDPGPPQLQSCGLSHCCEGLAMVTGTSVGFQSGGQLVWDRPGEDRYYSLTPIALSWDTLNAAVVTVEQIPDTGYLPEGYWQGYGSYQPMLARAVGPGTAELRATVLVPVTGATVGCAFPVRVFAPDLVERILFTQGGLGGNPYDLLAAWRNHDVAPVAVFGRFFLDSPPSPEWVDVYVDELATYNHVGPDVAVVRDPWARPYLRADGAETGLSTLAAELRGLRATADVIVEDDWSPKIVITTPAVLSKGSCNPIRLEAGYSTTGAIYDITPYESVYWTIWECSSAGQCEYRFFQGDGPVNRVTREMCWYCSDRVGPVSVTITAQALNGVGQTTITMDGCQ
ncbi:MAG: hypothetical protein HY897_11085 [Deltaproteobacteria bacterium]|nr:hypothetical protein [Deltaproteobacteria bacterium]